MPDKHLHSDVQLAHEIAHFAVSTPTERSYPEYGCQVGIVTNAYGPEIPDSISNEKFLLIDNERSGVLFEEEQEFREFCADLLGNYWCDEFGIYTLEEQRPTLKYWNQSLCWMAIQWLWDNDFIPQPK